MNLLYEVYNNDENGRHINTLGTIYAESKNEALKLSAEYFNNKEIYTTGFYNAMLVEASIEMENKDEYQANKLREAKWDILRYSTPIEF
tara:strand:+ start:364 stop:630 length:267 start_codon:yes stop_codon:yes gene_type:complete